MTSKYQHRLKTMNDYFIKGDYQNVIDYGTPIFPKLKKRMVRHSAAMLLGFAHYRLKQTKEAAKYLSQAVAIQPDKDAYRALLRSLRDDDDYNVEKYEFLVLEATKYYPDEKEFFEHLVTKYAKSKGDKAHKMMFYSLKAENWSMASANARSAVLWDLLDETDRLFVDALRRGDLDAGDSIRTAFAGLRCPLVTPQDMLYLTRKMAYDNWSEELKAPPLVKDVKRKGKLKIGYLSADFFQHATMLLMCRILELHDTKNFEIHLFYINEERDDLYKERLAALPHKKHYLHDLNTEESAQKIVDEGIHILVDLKGVTRDSRMEILVRRPAPVIVSWLGYPGTLGHERLADYIIGDPIVTPLELAKDYSEKLALMPYTYQPNDNTIMQETLLKREDIGLPKDKLVFCSFNNLQKLNPEQFDFWCRLLKDIPNSVLWLLGADSPFTVKRLALETKKRGITWDRLIFTGSKDFPFHRARLPLADMALDSFPYTSHTTGSDALRAGVPLIAQQGATFAARVSASLVNAMNCPELIARNAEEAYQKIMVLTQSPHLLAEIQALIRQGYKHAPLFNSLMFTRDLERMYEAIWAQHEAGKKDHIVLEPQDIVDDTPEAQKARARYDEVMAQLEEAKHGSSERKATSV